MRLYIGLLHYPVYNKNDQKITSAITNVDLHDLSRLSRTYGVKSFFVITPLKKQQRFAERIIAHWVAGYGASYNNLRKEAIELIRITPSLDSSVKEIRKIEGEDPLIIATCASEHLERSISYSSMKKVLGSDRVVFIIFGTAWGLHNEIINRADFILEPVKGNNDYNHLSVRTAAGIILDRLSGGYQQ